MKSLIRNKRMNFVAVAVTEARREQRKFKIILRNIYVLG